MRSKIFGLLGLLAVSLTGFVTFVGAQSTQSLPFVFLQGSTPGNTQSGHLHISGTAIAGQFQGGGAGLTNVNADLFDGLDSGAFLKGIPIPLSLTGSSGGAIIQGSNSGTASGLMGIRGDATSNAVNGTSYGGFFTAADDGGIGALGVSGGTAGYGLVGQNNATTGTTYGVYGVVLSGNGRAVSGVATAAGAPYAGYFRSSYIGVYGSSTSASGYGGYFLGDSLGALGRSDAESGIGLYGVNYGVSGIGVFGTSSDPNISYGVQGLSSATSGISYGVYGESRNAGAGVYGKNTSATGEGVIGESISGYAVLGISSATTGTTYAGRFETSGTTGRGVLGWSKSASAGAYGVLGQETGSGYGVYANGDVGASGTKSFRIDHPSDPANKYLLHYSIESPEVLNAYSGKVVLDHRGEAVVVLPTYFASINKDPRYTLTAIGAAMPNLHISEEIDERSLLIGSRIQEGDTPPICSFRISGGVAGAKVSWRVECLRNDLRMQRQPAPVEMDKPESERGTYQRPDYYGLVDDRGLVTPREEKALPSSRAKKVQNPR